MHSFFFKGNTVVNPHFLRLTLPWIISFLADKLKVFTGVKGAQKLKSFVIVIVTTAVKDTWERKNVMFLQLQM